jgi:peptide deformylase
MPKRPLTRYGDPVLKQKAAPVADFATAELEQLVADMFETCEAEEGVGLAAPQIGIPLRLFVVDCPENSDHPDGPRQRWAIVNPEIVERQGTVDSEEGCLSMPGLSGVVKRAKRVLVRGFTPAGEPMEVGAGGLLSRCIQHEVDHLDGVLFIDRLSTLKRQLLKRQLEEIAAGG